MIPRRHPLPLHPSKHAGSRVQSAAATLTRVVPARTARRGALLQLGAAYPAASRPCRHSPWCATPRYRFARVGPGIFRIWSEIVLAWPFKETGRGARIWAGARCRGVRYSDRRAVQAIGRIDRGADQNEGLNRTLAPLHILILSCQASRWPQPAEVLHAQCPAANIQATLHVCRVQVQGRISSPSRGISARRPKAPSKAPLSRVRTASSTRRL